MLEGFMTYSLSFSGTLWWHIHSYRQTIVEAAQYSPICWPLNGSTGTVGVKVLAQRPLSGCNGRRASASYSLSHLDLSCCSRRLNRRPFCHKLASPAFRHHYPMIYSSDGCSLQHILFWLYHNCIAKNGGGWGWTKGHTRFLPRTPEFTSLVKAKIPSVFLNLSKWLWLCSNVRMRHKKTYEASGHDNLGLEQVTLLCLVTSKFKVKMVLQWKKDYLFLTKFTRWIQSRTLCNLQFFVMCLYLSLTNKNKNVNNRIGIVLSSYCFPWIFEYWWAKTVSHKVLQSKTTFSHGKVTREWYISATTQAQKSQTELSLGGRQTYK